MYRILLLFILLSIVLPGFGQDSIIAENRFAHNIRNGEATPEKRAYEQVTFDKSGKKILLIKYDTLLATSSGTFFFYNDSLLISVEEYSAQNQILSVTRYAYNKNGLISSKRTYIPSGNRMVLSGAVIYKYKDGVLLNETFKDGKGKKISNTVYSYTGNQKTTVTTFKKSEPDENVRKITIIATLENGHLISEKIVKEYDNNTAEISNVKYLPGESEQEKSEEYYDGSGKLVKKIKYTYRRNGNLANKAILDANNNVLEFYSFRRNEFVINFGERTMTDLEKPVINQEIE